MLKNLNESKNSSENKIKAIEESNQYSEEYKKQLIQEEKEKFTNERFTLRDEVQKLIESTKKQLLDSRKPMTKDLTFEVRLNNALKSIELAGKNMNQDELKALVEPFTGDYLTNRTFFNIFKTMGLKTDGVILLDGIEEQITALDNVKNDLMDSIKYGNILKMSIAAEFLPSDTEGDE
jgi:ribosomal protein L17